MILNSWQMSWMAFSFLPNLLCLIFLVKYYGLVIIHHWIKMWGYLFSWSPHPPTKYLFWGNIWMWGWIGLSWWDKGRDWGASNSLRHSLSVPGVGQGPGVTDCTSPVFCVSCLLVSLISRCNNETASRCHQEIAGIALTQFKIIPAFKIPGILNSILKIQNSMIDFLKSLNSIYL